MSREGRAESSDGGRDWQDVVSQASWEGAAVLRALWVPPGPAPACLRPRPAPQPQTGGTLGFQRSSQARQDCCLDSPDAPGILSGLLRTGPTAASQIHGLGVRPHPSSAAHLIHSFFHSGDAAVQTLRLCLRRRHPPTPAPPRGWAALGEP